MQKWFSKTEEFAPARGRLQFRPPDPKFRTLSTTFYDAIALFQEASILLAAGVFW